MMREPLYNLLQSKKKRLESQRNYWAKNSEKQKGVPNTERQELARRALNLLYYQPNYHYASDMAKVLGVSVQKLNPALQILLKEDRIERKLTNPKSGKGGKNTYIYRIKKGR